MRKKMRVHSGSKEKVMSALAAVSGLGNLAGRKRSGKSDKITYEVDLKAKDLLSTDKLVALAVAKAAIDQLKVSAGEGLTSDEKREVERAVSSLVAGKDYRPSSTRLGFKLDFDPKAGVESLSINDGTNKMMVAQKDGLRNLVVCPNNFKGRGGPNNDLRDMSEKGRSAGRYAAQVLYHMLDTGLNTKKRKVSRLNKQNQLVEQFRMFLGPVGSSKDAKMELPADRCYRIELSDKLRAEAFKNTFLTQSSTVSNALQQEVRNVVDSVKAGYSSIGLARKDIDSKIIGGEEVVLNGLGQMDVPGEDLTLNGMRRRRRKGSKRKTASARRRKSPAKRKATRRRKAKK
jgi:hypothetical protein